MVRHAVEAGITLFDTADMYDRAPARRSPAGCCARLFATGTTTCWPRRSTSRCGRADQRRRPVPQARAGRDRRLAAPARHRPRRPLPDPPVGPDDADRGDHAGAATTWCAPARPATSAPPAMFGWQFAQAQERAGRRAGRRSCPCRTTTTSPTARRSGRCCRTAGDQGSACCRSARSPAACSPAAAAAPTGPRPSAAGPTRWPTRRTARATSTWSTRWSRWRPRVGYRRPRSRWPGCPAGRESTAPIVGATKIQHVSDAVAALAVTLDQDEVARLEAPYRPHPVLGHE